METVGSIVLVPNYQPMLESGLLECDGSSFSTSEYLALYEAVGNRYGGNENTFNVPLLEGGDGFKFGIVFLTSTEEENQFDEWEEAEPSIEESLKERMSWGTNVVRQFRLYTIEISDEQGLEMLSNLMDVKMTLDLGMLNAAAYLLQSKPADDLLDAQFDENQTVRERFLNMILNEGPSP